MVALFIEKERRTVQYFREQLGNDIELDVILVPGGSLLMGSPDTEAERSANEGPQHLVSVKSFLLGRYPVTQEQWQIVAETYEYVNIKDLNPQPSNFKGAKRPVEKVNWYEAKEYCDRLAKRTKRPYRLPTEAEWEYACRAGTTTPFYFGSTLTTELANYNGTSYIYGDDPTGKNRGETTPVDHFEIANAWGLCDMHGNVWEWCEDHFHDSYDDAPGDGSAWLTDNSGAPRVNRGAAWSYDPGLCRSASRAHSAPSSRYYGTGFRLAYTAPDFYTSVPSTLFTIGDQFK
jgi:formylglycine-generating enzyme required for sulfatase activity